MSSADRSRDRRRPAWLPLAVAALVVPTVLAGLTLLWPRPQIEAELTRTATGSLAAAGLTGAAVTFDGRDATVTGADAERAAEIVRGLPGVRVAQLPAGGGGGTGAPDAGDAAAAGPFGIARRGEDIVLTGVVGSAAERDALVAAATEQAGGRTVVDELTVTEGAPPRPGVTAAGVGSVTAVLAAAGDGVAASIDGDTLTLTGTSPDAASVQAAGDELGAALPGTTVDNRLAVASGGGTAPEGGLDDAGRRDLQSAIDALTAAAPVTFEPDSPELTATGAATVEEIVRLVARTPGARLQVDGYVATGPGAGVLTAQELSDRRAATVRDALVAGGVPGDAITARGLGEGDSPTAQAAGRRVEITVV